MINIGNTTPVAALPEGRELAVADENLVDYIIKSADKQRQYARDTEFKHQL